MQYHIGGVIADRNSLLVTKPEMLRGRFQLDLRINTEVASINREAKTIEIRDVVSGAKSTEVRHTRTCVSCRTRCIP
jgi:NADPH-dependent 2,4-dienoyl-CoA reductase/sulfur reductase-like enzyme